MPTIRFSFLAALSVEAFLFWIGFENEKIVGTASFFNRFAPGLFSIRSFYKFESKRNKPTVNQLLDNIARKYQFWTLLLRGNQTFCLV